MTEDEPPPLADPRFVPVTWRGPLPTRTRERRRPRRRDVGPVPHDYIPAPVDEWLEEREGGAEAAGGGADS